MINEVPGSGVNVVSGRSSQESVENRKERSSALSDSKTGKTHDRITFSKEALALAKSEERGVNHVEQEQATPQSSDTNISSPQVKGRVIDIRV